MVEADVGFQGQTGLDRSLSVDHKRIEWECSTAPTCVASPRPGYVAATELFCSRDDGSSRGLLCSGPLVTEPRPLTALYVAFFIESNQAFAERKKSSTRQYDTHFPGNCAATERPCFLLTYDFIMTKTIAYYSTAVCHHHQPQITGIRKTTALLAYLSV
jgi:hypothetical protein